MGDSVRALGSGSGTAAAGYAGATRTQGCNESPSLPTGPDGVGFSVQVPPAFGIQHQPRHLLGAQIIMMDFCSGVIACVV